jgi:type II secretory pathway component GspD/PulD (secretin)
MNRRLPSALVAAAILVVLPCAHGSQSAASLNQAPDPEKARKLYLEGAKALEAKDFSTAETDFTRAAAFDPENAQYGAARDIVVSHHATALIQAADKAKMLGHREEAQADLLLAYRIDPKNPMLAQHLDEIGAAAAPDPIQLHPGDESFEPPVEIAPTPGLHNFHVHAEAGELLRQVLSTYGLTPVIDDSVHNVNVRLDVDNVSFNQAARMVRLLTNTIFVPLDPKRVLIAADTKENRTKFQRLAYETVYFPGLNDAEVGEVGQIARNVFDAQQANASASNDTLAVRAPQPELAALNGTLSELLDGHSEIQLEVRLYDIARTKSKNIGIQLPQQTTVFNIPSELNSVISQNEALVQQIISSGLASPGDLGAIALALLASGQLSGSSILSQPFAYFGGGLTLTGITTSGLSGNLALNSSDSRVLDHITMRALDREEATIKAGERYPIITSSYSNFGSSSLGIAGLSSAGISSELASLGISASQLQSGLSQTIPQVQYQDLGLTLKVKPYIQKDQDVTLNLDLKITALQGTSLNNIPVLSNQEFTAITTLRQGASALLVSDLSKQQSGAVSGVPGLSDLPGFQSTTNSQTENDFSDLVILITPRIIRLAHTRDAGKMFFLPIH